MDKFVVPPMHLEKVVSGDDGHQHVIPLIGREHTPSRKCWCHPEVEDDLYIHHLEQ